MTDDMLRAILRQMARNAGTAYMRGDYAMENAWLSLFTELTYDWGGTPEWSCD